MPSTQHFPLKFIQELAREFGLPSNLLQEALQEGERIWSVTRRDNQEDKEGMRKARRILHQIRDYQRGKQNTLNADVRELITWHQTYFRTGN